MDYDTLTRWSERAQMQTMETLPSFVDELAAEAVSNHYQTVSVAYVAGIATFYAHFPTSANMATRYVAESAHYLAQDGPIHTLWLGDMLYPQYAARFKSHIISQNTWESLVRRAAILLSSTGHGAPEVRAHWLSIVNGIVPFGYSVEG